MSPGYDLSRCSIGELIAGGDWAGAHALDETLAAVARQLAGRVRPSERGALEDLARLCAHDLGAATALWLEATAGVRGRCGLAGPRRDDPIAS